jgi:3-dehydroquinate synthase
MHYRFGEYTSTVYVCTSIDPDRFTADSGIVMVFDKNTTQILSPVDSTARVVLPPGEKTKNWPGAERIIRKALSAGLGRDGLIVGIGGGMICDLAAFSASLYMRGCRLFLVPTTLLAMVDAAIGGKTAINIQGFKNTAGTFYPAEQIWIAVDTLSGLPEREYRSGLGEVIKTALLGDHDLLNILRDKKQKVLQRDPATLEEMVRRCVSVKASFVEEDLRETGRRAFLNLGHTYAHAMEAVTNYKLWTHGQAVAWGLMQAAFLSEELGLTGSDYPEMVRDLLLAYGFELQTRQEAQVLVTAMQVDKKRRRGKLRLVLQRGIEDTVVREVDPLLIVETLKRSAGLYS